LNNSHFSIRPYTKADRDLLIYLLDLNTPAYFAATEKRDFTHYLDKEIEEYFVIESSGQVIGCGGINYADNLSTGIISWDMLHPEARGKGAGSLLLKHRLDLLFSKDRVQKVIVRTSQHAWGFYEKNGFILQRRVKDHWAPGFDLYFMELAGFRAGKRHDRAIVDR
jgi:[ribosomal protein S18]-alanine N-acetyltransferase